MLYTQVTTVESTMVRKYRKEGLFFERSERIGEDTLMSFMIEFIEYLEIGNFWLY